jgi:hypothetical protein
LKDLGDGDGPEHEPEATSNGYEDIAQEPIFNGALFDFSFVKASGWNSFDNGLGGDSRKA